MGWSSGADLADKLWNDIVDFIPEHNRVSVAKAFVKSFEDYDCDCMCETTLYELVDDSRLNPGDAVIITDTCSMHMDYNIGDKATIIDSIDLTSVEIKMYDGRYQWVQNWQIRKEEP